MVCLETINDIGSLIKNFYRPVVRSMTQVFRVIVLQALNSSVFNENNIQNINVRISEPINISLLQPLLMLYSSSNK